jgi:DNA replication protein DnaC
VAKAIERLVSFRYEHNLRTMFTSNLPWSEVTEGRAYGRRVADRLNQLCQGVAWDMRGPSWRNPPEVEERGRPVAVDRKAVASDPQLALPPRHG